MSESSECGDTDTNRLPIKMINIESLQVNFMVSRGGSGGY